ncbi:UNVERIFIED_CONTAM: hypothetical protein K2H54_026001 [Gekko kuhli]
MTGYVEYLECLVARLCYWLQIQATQANKGHWTAPSSGPPNGCRVIDRRGGHRERQAHTYEDEPCKGPASSGQEASLQVTAGLLSPPPAECRANAGGFLTRHPCCDRARRDGDDGETRLALGGGAAMGLPRLLPVLLFAHLRLAIDASQGPAVPDKGKAIKGERAVYNKNAAFPAASPRSRSAETESTVLAQRLAQEVPQNVASFLYTGDSRELRHANCTGRYELATLAGKSRLTSHPSLHGALDTLIHATNFLNMILQSNKSREQNLQEDIEWYQALIRSLLEGDPNISRAAISFNLDPLSSAPQVFLQASRQDSQILLQDLSSVARHLANTSGETEWFHSLKRKWRPHLHHKVLAPGSKALESSWKKRDGYPAEKNHIKWSSPYLECENGNYKPTWLVTLSAAFYGLQPNLLPEFR